jgi:hypothetical protein
VALTLFKPGNSCDGKELNYSYEHVTVEERAMNLSLYCVLGFDGGLATNESLKKKEMKGDDNKLETSANERLTLLLVHASVL